MFTKEKLKLLFVNNREFDTRLFLTYAPKNHSLAHLYEHIIYEKLKHNGFIVTKATTGSGIINISFKSRKQISNEEIINILNLKRNGIEFFKNEKERMLMELKEKLNEKTRFYYQAIQYRIFNQKLLEKEINKIKKIKFNEVIAQVNNFKNIVIILSGPKFKNDKKINSDLLILENKQKLKNPSSIKELTKKTHQIINCQINLRVSIKNELEATCLSILSKILYRPLEQKLMTFGIYQVKRDVYKDYDKFLYLNYSFFCNANLADKIFKIVKKIIKETSLSNKEIKTEKEILVADIKKKKSIIKEKENYIWQKIEWGNFMPPKELIKRIQEINIKKFWIKKRKLVKWYFVRIN
jgi:hypothetical protein